MEKGEWHCHSWKWQLAHEFFPIIYTHHQLVWKDFCFRQGRGVYGVLEKGWHGGQDSFVLIGHDFYGLLFWWQQDCRGQLFSNCLLWKSSFGKLPTGPEWGQGSRVPEKQLVYAFDILYLYEFLYERHTQSWKSLENYPFSPTLIFERWDCRDPKGRPDSPYWNISRLRTWADIHFSLFKFQFSYEWTMLSVLLWLWSSSLKWPISKEASCHK